MEAAAAAGPHARAGHVRLPALKVAPGFDYTSFDGEKVAPRTLNRQREKAKAAIGMRATATRTETGLPDEKGGVGLLVRQGH